MYCSKCGKQIKDDSQFCPYCGNKINNNVYDDPKAVYIVKQPNETKDYYLAAAKTSKETLIVGILESIGFVFNLILIIVLTAITNMAQATAIAILTIWILVMLGLGIPGLICVIKTFTRSKALKLHTNVNPKFVILSYALSISINYVFCLVGYILMLIPNNSATSTTGYVLMWLGILCGIYLIVVSFVISSRIKKTLHR